MTYQKCFQDCQSACESNLECKKNHLISFYFFCVRMYSKSFTHFEVKITLNFFSLLIFSTFSDLCMCMSVSVCIAVLLFFQTNCSCFSLKQREREREQTSIQLLCCGFPSILKWFSCFARVKKNNRVIRKKGKKERR